MTPKQERGEKEKKHLENPKTSENPKTPTKPAHNTQRLIHHIRPYCHAPARTKIPGIIIDRALKVLHFTTHFKLRSGDWSLLTMLLIN
jgi:hypothetical protein